MDNYNFFTKENYKDINNREEIEKAKKENHSNFILNRINMHRNIDLFPLSKNQKRTSIIEPFNAELINSCINEIMELFVQLPPSNSIASCTKVTIDNLHIKILELLKNVRKELSKVNISSMDFQNILNSKTQEFIELLINPFKDTNYPFIQLESLWIINNLIYIMGIHGINAFNLEKIAINLSFLLINKYKNIQNEGVRNTLMEKAFRIYGNIICINNNVIDVLNNNQIIPLIIDSLNTSISPFRTCCLWLLNKILLVLERTNKLKISLNYFISKAAIFNYKFIMTRLENQKSFDEMGELFWLFNELLKFDTSFIFPIFFIDKPGMNMAIESNNNSITNYFSNNDYNNYGIPIKNFIIVIDNSLTMKMFQTSFRLISNLITICPDENLLTKFIEIIFERKNVIIFLNDVLNSPMNKYDISLVKDVLLLIFNLICISFTKSCVHFKKGIVNLISDRDYQNDNEIMKLLFLTYYRILVSSHFNYEPNDEKAIKTALIVMPRFSNDESLLIIFTDILYNYLKASHTHFDPEIDNYIECLAKEVNQIPVEKYQNILEKLFSLITIHSPISRFMKNS